MKPCYVLLIVIFFTTETLAKTPIQNRVTLESLIVNQRLTSNAEDFYFLEDGTLLYHELDNGNITNGLWFIKQATYNYDSPSPYKKWSPSDNERVGKPVICIAVNTTSRTEFSWLPCSRLYHEEDNLYVAHQTQCNLDEPLVNEVIHCNWTRRTFQRYRINQIEQD